MKKEAHTNENGDRWDIIMDKLFVQQLSKASFLSQPQQPHTRTKEMMKMMHKEALCFTSTRYGTRVR